MCRWGLLKVVLSLRSATNPFRRDLGGTVQGSRRERLGPLIQYFKRGEDGVWENLVQARDEIGNDRNPPTKIL